MPAHLGGPHPRLHDWFTRSAHHHGEDLTALEVDGHRLTYAALDALAAAAAETILDAHGSPPTRVGLLASRSVLAYAGYLGITRLGATVVPLNPAFPVARSSAIAKEAGLDLVVADAGLPCLGGLAVPVVPLTDRDLLDRSTAAVSELPEPSVSGSDLAYILFTSGSTGRPKGVPVTHDNVAAFLGHVIPRYELGPGARVSQTFDLTFDPSVYDMFAAWGSGATLVVPTRNDLLSPVRYVNERQITHWNSVPSVAAIAMRLRALKPGAMPSLRWSLFCGEALKTAHAKAWAAAAPNSTLENVYGPTEMTVTWTEYRLPADPSDWPDTGNATVPIGTPYPGQEHLVLDENGHPADEGELCVRGTQRFPGYLIPADNTGRFCSFDGQRATVYDGSSPISADHWYRTGDQVRQLDGTLVHLGRLDHQLKIHGYRVELGEIEHLLMQQPGVTDAVVLAIPGRKGKLRLHALCTGGPANPATLLDTLRAKLPAYMVPAAVEFTAALPLNANGKVDRAALVVSLSRSEAA